MGSAGVGAGINNDNVYTHASLNFVVAIEQDFFNQSIALLISDNRTIGRYYVIKGQISLLKNQQFQKVEQDAIIILK